MSFGNNDHCELQETSWSYHLGQVPSLQETRMPAQAKILFEHEGPKVFLKRAQGTQGFVGMSSTKFSNEEIPLLKN